MGKVGVVGPITFGLGIGNGGPMLLVLMNFLGLRRFFLFLRLKKHTTSETMMIKPAPDAEIAMMMMICFLLSLTSVFNVTGSKVSTHVKFLVSKMYNWDEVDTG